MYLLDTHTLVWGVAAPEKLPPRVREILAEGEVKASVVSYWELILKKGRPSSLVLDPLLWWERYVTRHAVEVLPIRVMHVDRLNELAERHRDPFDRMLVAQAMAEGLTLASKDKTLAHYGVPLVWE
ncbi:MAG: type II toxin-antitoxin system VapC family toxin [Bryobacteraceae bacterium]|nr:type II toxin-antitoxin system VapC family toxin [Bryobacteraceae bacterium]